MKRIAALVLVLLCALVALPAGGQPVSTSTPAPRLWQWVKLTGAPADAGTGLFSKCLSSPSTFFAEGLGTSGSPSSDAVDVVGAAANTAGVPHRVVFANAAGAGANVNIGPGHEGVGGTVQASPFDWNRNVTVTGGTTYRSAFVSAVNTRISNGLIAGGVIVYTGPPVAGSATDNTTLDALYIAERSITGGATPAVDVLPLLDFNQSSPAKSAILRYNSVTSGGRVIGEPIVRRDCPGSNAWIPYLASTAADYLNTVNAIEYGPGTDTPPAVGTKAAWLKGHQVMERNARPAVILEATGDATQRLNWAKHYGTMGYDVWLDFGGMSGAQVAEAYQHFAALAVGIDSGWTPTFDGSGFAQLGPDRVTGAWAGQPGGDRIVFVSSSAGNDSNPGTSGSPKATLAAGLAQLRAGHADWVLLKRGDTWTISGGNTVNVSGVSAGTPAGIGAYGTGARPVIVQSTGSAGVFNFDGGLISDLVVRDLYLKNAATVVSGGGGGASVAVNVNRLGSRAYFENCVIEGFAGGIQINPNDWASTRTMTYRKDDWIRRCAFVNQIWQPACQTAAPLFVRWSMRTTIDQCVAGVDTTSGFHVGHHLYAEDYSRDIRVRDTLVYQGGLTSLAIRSSGKMTGNIALNCYDGLSAGRDYQVDDQAGQVFGTNTSSGNSPKLPYPDGCLLSGNVVAGSIVGADALCTGFLPNESWAIEGRWVDAMNVQSTLITGGDPALSKLAFAHDSLLDAKYGKVWIDSFYRTANGPFSWATAQLYNPRRVNWSNVEVNQPYTGYTFALNGTPWPALVTVPSGNLVRSPDPRLIDPAAAGGGYVDRGGTAIDGETLSSWPASAGGGNANTTLDLLVQYGALNGYWTDYAGCWGFFKARALAENWSLTPGGAASAMIGMRDRTIARLVANTALLEDVPAASRPADLSAYGFTGRLYRAGVAGGVALQSAGVPAGIAAVNTAADAAAYGSRTVVLGSVGTLWSGATDDQKNAAMAALRRVWSAQRIGVLGAGAGDADIAPIADHWNAATQTCPTCAAPNPGLYNAYVAKWDSLNNRAGGGVGGGGGRLPVGLAADGIAVDLSLISGRSYADWLKVCNLKTSLAKSALGKASSTGAGIVLGVIGNCRSITDATLIAQMVSDIRSAGAVPVLADTSTALFNPREAWVLSTGTGQTDTPATGTWSKDPATIVSGDVVYVSGVVRKANGQAAQYGWTGLNNVQIRQAPNQPQAIFRGDTPLPTTGWSASGNGWSMTITTGLTLDAVVYGWDEQIDSNGRHYGHLAPVSLATVQAGTGAPGLYHYNSGTGVLTVYLGGANPNTGTKFVSYCVTTGKDAISFSNGYNITVDGIQFQLYPSTENGYGVSMADCQGSVISNCVGEDMGKHAFGFLNNTSHNFSNRIVNCVAKGLSVGGTHFVHYVATGFGTTNAAVVDSTARRYRYLGLDTTGGVANTRAGQSAMSQAAYLAHSDAGQAGVSDVLLSGITVIDDEPAGAFAQASEQASISAGDLWTWSKYPLRVDGGTWSHRPDTSSGATWTSPIAVRRLKYTQVGDPPQDVGSHAVIGMGYGATNTSTMLWESCAFQFTLSTVASNFRSTYAFGVETSGGTSGGIRLLNCTAVNNGATRGIFGACFFSFRNNNSPIIKARGSIFAHQNQGSVQILCIDDAGVSAANHDFVDCVYYNIGNNDWYSQNSAIDAKSEWLASVDTVGIVPASQPLADLPALTIGNTSPIYGLKRQTSAIVPSFDVDGYAYAGWYGAYLYPRTIITASNPGSRGLRARLWDGRKR